MGFYLVLVSTKNPGTLLDAAGASAIGPGGGPGPARGGRPSGVNGGYRPGHLASLG
jgi:hypothetical protein